MGVFSLPFVGCLDFLKISLPGASKFHTKKRQMGPKLPFKFPRGAVEGKINWNHILFRLVP